MKKITSLLLTCALIFASTPMVQAEENNPDTASRQKCNDLADNRERARCFRNNRKTRRHDLRIKIRKNTSEVEQASKEDFQQRTRRWNKSRSALKQDCRSIAAQKTTGQLSKRAALNRCLKGLKQEVKEKKASGTDRLRHVRRAKRNRIKDEGSTRRKFRENASEVQRDRRVRLKKRGMHHFKRTAGIEDAETDGASDDAGDE